LCDLNEFEIGRGNNPVVLEARVHLISDLVERPLILAPKEMLTAVMDSWRLHALLPSTPVLVQQSLSKSTECHAKTDK